MNRIEGPVFPIVTPFRENGKLLKPIDEIALNRYVEYLIDQGAGVIMVASATSRFAQLTLDECKYINEQVVKFADKKATVIASTPITGSTDQHVEVARHAEAVGADIIACEFPWRFQNNEALVNYFRTIEKFTGVIGIMLHVTPARSEVQTEFGGNYRYSLDVLNEICKMDRVVGLKEASADIQHSRAIWQDLSPRTSVIVAGKASETFLEASKYGVSGYFVGTGSIVPKPSLEIFKFIRLGQIGKAENLIKSQETPFLHQAKIIGWHAALKKALAIMGLMEETERPPMVPISPQDAEILYRIMENCGWLN